MPPTRVKTTQQRPLVITQTAHTLAVKDWVRYDSSSSLYVKAQANNAANAEVIGRVVAVTTNTFDLQTSGQMAIDTGLAVGEVYRLSDTTAGSMITTVPTGLGQVDKPVFVAVSSTTGYIINYRGLVLTSVLVARTPALTITANATTPNCDTTDLALLTLNVATTLINNPAGTPQDDQKLRIRIRQDATGSRLVTWGNQYRFPGNVNPTLTVTANKTDYVGFVWNTADNKWDNIAYITNI